MLQPIERPLASSAPRLAASMIPGPPPVITGMPACASSRAVSTAAGYCGSSGLVRAEPKIDTPSLHVRQVVEAPDELAHDAEHPPGIRDQNLLLLVALLGLRPLEEGFVLGWTLVVVHRAVGAIGHTSSRVS